MSGTNNNTTVNNNLHGSKYSVNSKDNHNATSYNNYNNYNNHYTNNLNDTLGSNNFSATENIRHKNRFRTLPPNCDD